MKKTKFNFKLLTLLVLFTQNSIAFDFSILRNDKEAESHAYSNRELHHALKRNGDLDEAATNRVHEIFNDLESKRQLCELPLLKRLEENFQNTHDLMILLRDRNYIDDLFFEIMDHASDLSGRLDRFQVWRVTPWEIEQSESLMKKTSVSLVDLGELYSFINGFSLRNPGCTLSRWSRLATDLTQLGGSHETLRLFNILALQKGIIGNDEFELLEFYRFDESSSAVITLARYLENSKEAKNRYLPKNPSDADLEQNHFSSKLIQWRKGPTYRQSLYYRFNSTQISMIANLMKRTFQRMDASKAEITFTHDGSSETFEISPMGQYYLARNLLKKDLEDLNRSSLFSGNYVSHEDVVTAALETGLINGKVVDSVLKIDDLWNPEVSQWDKLSRFAMRITGTATLFLPPPYNMISSTALVFLDGIIYRKHKRSRQSEALYDFF